MDIPTNFDANAKTVDLSGCTALETVPDLPNAAYVYLSGCTAAAQTWIETNLEPLLRATGKTVSDVIRTGCWDCHEWANCPMHEVFGTNSISGVPKEWRGVAAVFVGLFDAGLIPCPAVPAEA